MEYVIPLTERAQLNLLADGCGIWGILTHVLTIGSTLFWCTPPCENIFLGYGGKIKPQQYLINKNKDMSQLESNVLSLMDSHASLGLSCFPLLCNLVMINDIVMTEALFSVTFTEQ